MSAFTKESLRAIRSSLGRFLAIAAIVALGCGFYAGLRMAGPDMRIAGDRFFDGTSLYDIRVVSSMGWTEKQADLIADVEGVESLMCVKGVDVMAVLDGEQYAMRMQTLNVQAAEKSVSVDGAHVESDDPSYLNRLVLEQGRWPTNPGECVLSADRVMVSPVNMGDPIQVLYGESDLDGVLSTKELTVVGLIHSPSYVSAVTQGSTTLGSGQIQQFMYVAPSTFDESYPFTEIDVKVQGTANEFSGSQAYQAKVDAVEKRIEDMAEGLAENRREQIVDEELGEIARLLAFAAGDDAVENPEVYVLDRTQNFGIASFEDDSERIDNIASVFPFIFFLVAALVALTTMTRMVDEDRVTIGTFKALGYSKARITGKYLAYAGAASGLGAVVGIAVLSQVLPYVIMLAYAIIYNVPQSPLPLPIDWPIALTSGGLGVGATLGATWAACASTLREQPAQLMLPRAPKAGKRILFERIGPLWRRLSFSWKVTIRNLVRYKKRLFMTVIGIAGCTGLLLTGLGLHDAIWDIIDKHYDNVVRYNMVVQLKKGSTDSDKEEVWDLMAAQGTAPEHAWAADLNRQAGSNSSNNLGLTMTIPENPQDFARIIDLHTREGHEPVPLDENSVVINEKLSRTLGVGVGDTIKVYEQDDVGNAVGQGYPLQVSGIVEYYVGNTLIVGSQAYSQATGKEPSYTSVYASGTDDAQVRRTLTDDLHNVECVQTVAYNDETIDSYRTMLSSVNMIVVVLVVSAAALAFIVLYNLTNINITERRREIASLKVLGFTRSEVNAYIFREIGLLTLIGALLGLVLGVGMESFVVQTAEVDYVMFGREIHLPSFVGAFALTVVFSSLVMFAMTPKLKHIDMVESLKSIE